MPAATGRVLIVWGQSRLRRYRLGTPSPAYSQAWGPMKRRLEIAARAARTLRDNPSASADAVQEKVLLGGVPGLGSDRFSVHVLDREAGFLEAQLTALYQVWG